MKKYVVKYKEDGKVFGEYASKEEASKRLIEYFNDYNDDICVDFASPFDFVLEEVECGEVNEAITDFETARKFLGIKPNDDLAVVRKKHSEYAIQLYDASMLVNEINPNNIEALVALNRLFTIAEAWNKADGFVPDFSDWSQAKYYPWFKYDKDAAGFVLAATHDTPSHASASFGSRLCFKTRERATQFGKKFTDLYNKVFLNT